MTIHPAVLAHQGKVLNRSDSLIPVGEAQVPGRRQISTDLEGDEVEVPCTNRLVVSAQLHSAGPKYRVQSGRRVVFALKTPRVSPSILDDMPSPP